MSTFTTSVAHYTEGLTVAPGPAACCSTCLDAYGVEDTGDIDAMQEQMLDEGNFASAQCDSCGSTLAGDRFDAHGIAHEFKAGERTIIHMDICTDCLLFHANGDEPESW